MRAQNLSLIIFGLCSTSPLFGCTDIADLTTFSDPNGANAPSKASQQIDTDCATTAKGRAHDAGYYLYGGDIHGLQQKVYKQTYEDCVSWKAKHGE